MITERQQKLLENAAQFLRGSDTAEAILAALSALNAQAEPVAWMDDGNVRAGNDHNAFRVVTAATKANMPKAAYESFNTPLYASPCDALKMNGKNN